MVLTRMFKGVQQYIERSGIRGVDEGCIRLQDMFSCVLVSLLACWFVLVILLVCSLVCMLASFLACPFACFVCLLAFLLLYLLICTRW